MIELPVYVLGFDKFFWTFCHHAGLKLWDNGFLYCISVLAGAISTGEDLVSFSGRISVWQSSQDISLMIILSSVIAGGDWGTTNVMCLFIPW